MKHIAQEEIQRNLDEAQIEVEPSSDVPLCVSICLGGGEGMGEQEHLGRFRRRDLGSNVRHLAGSLEITRMGAEKKDGRAHGHS